MERILMYHNIQIFRLEEIMIYAVLVLVALYVFIVFPGRPKAGQKDAFKGLQAAHRGLYSKDQSVPENSLPAFRLAVENGYGAELDLQLTKDGQVIVFHDDLLMRMTGCELTPQDYTYAELLEMSLMGTEEKIPLFSEVVEIFKNGTPLIVELKTCENYKELCEASLPLIRQLECPYCVESFDPRIVAWFRKNAPDIMRGQLSEPYRNYREEKASPMVALAFSAMWGNVKARPQFIAYTSGRRTLAWFIGKITGTFMVYWTERPDDDHELLKKRYDCLIFEHFRPDSRYMK
jgi:glycerophosphoryl diester phosphodiesterase